MSVLLPVLAAPFILAPLVKWWRVAQREHYIVGSVLASHRRWVTADLGRNGPLVAIELVGVVVACLPIDNAIRGGGLVVATIAALLFPIGLGFRGRTARLRYTPRLRRIVVTTLVVMAIVAVVIAVLADLIAAAAISIPMATLAVEASLWVLTPVEARLSRKFRATAVAKMEQVSPKVVAITGSYGKTSTKEHVATLLGTRFQVFATPGSWNNEAGLSRAINERMPANTEIFVAEMGTYGPGEIAQLCQWLPPTVSAITAIGPVHLERMKSLDNITRAKSEIASTAETVVLNTDYPHLADLADELDRETGKTIVRVGSNATDVSLTDGRIRLRSGTERGIELDDAVHAGNAAVAVGIALACGLDEETAVATLPALHPSYHRASETTSEDGIVIIDDTFNSNPEGAAAALGRLVELTAAGRRVVVTPGMVELGPKQAEENAKFAAAVVDAGAQLVVVGNVNRRALVSGAGRGEVHHVRNRDQAREWVREHLGPGDGVLWESDLPDHYP